MEMNEQQITAAVPAVTVPAESPEPVVYERGGRVFANSRDVAEFFGKEHRNVLRDIRGVLKSEQTPRDWFCETMIEDPQNGQTYPAYEMSRDGFVLLVFGYDGPKAMPLKVRWIQKFNAMESALKSGGRVEAMKATAAQARAVNTVFRSFHGIYKLAGLDKNQCAIAAAQATYRETGINPLQIGGATHLPTEHKTVLLTATEIGKRLGIGARDVNKLLESHGLQTGYRGTKNEQKWEPTETGAAFVEWHDTGKRHGDGTPVRGFKWSSSVIDRIASGEAN